VENKEQVLGSKRFGGYLKSIRENRRLSLDAVEEMTNSYPERVTKSHLSRIENGLAIPTFPRLLALGQVYGVPIGFLAERFEIELRREETPIDLGTRSDEDVAEEVQGLRHAGRYSDALMLLLAISDRRGYEVSPLSTDPANAARVEVRLQIVNCLTHMGRLETAKQHVEEILTREPLGPVHRLIALHSFVVACFRLGRYAVAKMALDQADAALREHDAEPGERDFAADFALLRGNVAMSLADPATACAAYVEALRRFEAAPNKFDACRTRVMLGAAYGGLGRAQEAEATLQAGLHEAEESGYDRFAALALHHLGVIAYRSGDLRGAGTYLLRSNGLARPRDYVALVFSNCFYLWRMARETGDVAAARANVRSLRSLVGRVEEALPEVEEFRAAIARGES
jgi:transcriptional regulator with XRE-family HTH domain/predicted negative regulator of RcsB-dependent stress response